MNPDPMLPAAQPGPPGRLALAAGRRLRAAASKLLPRDTARGRLARSALNRVRRMRFDGRHASPLSIAQILRENRDRKGILVYPPFIDWSWMRQRPHQLVDHFARAGYLSLYCSPKYWGDQFDGFVRLGERLYLCDALDPLFDLPQCLVLVGWTGHWETARRFRDPVVIYDYLDDLSVSSEGRPPDEHKCELHRKLVAGSEVVLATARRLHEEVTRVRPDALLCPNGADYEHFHVSAAPPTPADIADLVAAGRPIIGYYGALARWFDYDLLAHAASMRKDYEFLLIGPNLDGSLKRHDLLRLPNVRWLSEKTYDELPSYLYRFSVATIPFVLNNVTAATSPVKLFEYMAGGKPIVASDMPECRQYSCVLTARDAVEYVVLLDEALQRGQLESHRRWLDQTARANTWEARVHQIVARLAALPVREKLRSA